MDSFSSFFFLFLEVGTLFVAGNLNFAPAPIRGELSAQQKIRDITRQVIP